VEVAFDKMALVDHAVFHLQLAEAVVPSFFVLSFVLIVEPGCHYKLYSSAIIIFASIEGVCQKKRRVFGGDNILKF